MSKAVPKKTVVAAAKKVAVAPKPDAAAPAVAADKASDEPAGDKPVATVDAEVPGALLVRTKKGVVRRCRSGFEFGPKAKPVPLDDLSQEQLEAILNDPLLEVPQPDADSEEAAA